MKKKRRRRGRKRREGKEMDEKENMFGCVLICV